MEKENKGGFRRDGMKLVRETAKCTKTGIVLTKGAGDHYYMDFPDGTVIFGISNARSLGDLFYYLSQYDGDIDKAFKKVFRL